MAEIDLDFKPTVPVFDANVLLGRRHDRWPEPRRYMGLAQRYPNIKWVIAHGGNGPFGQEDAVAAAQASRNIYLETSTSFGDGRTIGFLVEGAGEDRVLFGSDMPEQDVCYQLGRVVTADITVQAKRKVLGLNAMSLLELGE
jgi:predicted TIM-barrel fold metal-dependent hydrolase